jgi:SAM-dependent methyltransferase
MSYSGLQAVHSDEHKHLGGNIRGGDPFTYCPSVWDYVISRFGIESVLDLGCGSGNAALYFHRKGLRVVAVDGLAENVTNGMYPAIKQDITTGPVVTKVDLVHCQEVVEHIDEAHLNNLMASLVTGKIILLTHATPGQSGYHHVNEQPMEYWRHHFAARDCHVLEQDTNRVRELATRDGALYMARTGLVFGNAKRM